MFAKYNIELPLQINKSYEHIESYNEWESFQKTEQRIQKRLETYLMNDDGLSVADMESDWFPQIKKHVFISHSHSDQTLAKELAYLLDNTFGIKCFVDSVVWGYADDLLKKIDDIYCKFPNKDSYNYKKRNRSTAHIHMILTGALTKMLDECECLLFLNTPRSLKTSEIGNIEMTSSPWIYSELLMAGLLRKKIPPRYLLRKLSSVDGTENYSQKELRFNYKTMLNSFININLNDFLGLLSQKVHRTPEEYLDYLYSSTM